MTLPDSSKTRIVMFLIAGLTLSASATGKPLPTRSRQTEKQSRPATDRKPTAGNTKDKQIAEEATDAATPSLPLFPDWSSPSFNWGIDPIFGVKMSQTEESGNKISSYSTEGGAAARLSDIPIIPPNPGLTTSPYVGYSVGQYGVRANDGQTKTSNASSFSRLWGGNDLSLYLKFYRHVLGVGRGVLTYQKSFKKLQSLSIDNDAGILVLPFLSTHYTLRDLKLYREKTTELLLRQTDHWIHGRLFFDWHNFIFDIGPGFTRDKDYNELETGDTKVRSIYDTSYFLAKNSMQLFWKIHMTAQAKYIVSTDLRASDDTIDFIQLPYQGVNATKDIQNMPDDSLDAALFIGASDIIGGFGMGWYYNRQELNMSEKDGKSRVVTAQQGYTLSYSLSL